MIRMHIELKPGGVTPKMLQTAGKNFERDLKRLLHDWGKKIVADMKSGAPKGSTGELVRSIDYEVNLAVARLFVNIKAPHARWLELGTGIYSQDPQATSKKGIFPKNAKVLKIPQGRFFLGQLPRDIRAVDPAPLKKDPTKYAKRIFVGVKFSQYARGIRPRAYFMKKMATYLPMVQRDVLALVQRYGFQ